MSVARTHHTKDYTCMSNHHFKDKNLSLKAKGLLSLMLSLPEMWDYNIKGLAELSSDGETSVRSGIKELEDNHYVKRTPVREYGRIVDWEYDIYELPFDESPVVENQQVENPLLEIKANKVRNKSNTNKSSNKSISKDIDTDFDFGFKEKKSKKSTLWDKCLAEIDKFTDDKILRENLISALQLFLENSRESGVPFYTNTFKGKLNTLAKLTDNIYEQDKIVCQTLDQGWNNFYEIKTDKRKSSDTSKDIEHLYHGLNKKAKKGGSTDAKF